jgi:outer membrane protein assembly factor BamB
MSNGGDERRGATPSAEWTASIDGPVTSVALHDRANAVVVGVAEESPAGPAVAIFAADDGSRRGRVALDEELVRSDYHPDPDTLFVGTSARIYAVDPETGELAWEAQISSAEKTAPNPQVGPTVDGTTYLYSGANLWAYRTHDGARQWRTSLPHTVATTLSKDWDPITPLGNRLLVDLGMHDIGVVSIDPETGDEAWYHRPDDVNCHQFDAGKLYIVFAEEKENLVRVNTSTGAPQWTYTTNYSLRSARIYPASELAYLRLPGTIVAVDVASGQERWRSEKYYGADRLWVGDEEVYAGLKLDNREDYHFGAFDAGTGRTAWETEVDQTVLTVAETNSETSDIYAGTKSFKGNGGTVYCLNAGTGQIRWTSEIGESVRSLYPDTDPTVVHTFDDLHGIDRSNGRVRWSFGDESMTITYAGDQYVVVFDHQAHYVLNRSDGTTAWRLDRREYSVDDGEDLLIVAGDETLSVHPLVENPAAFDDGETTIYERDTEDEVRAPDDGTDDDTDTEVYTPDDTDTDVPAFCPTCGTDLDEYDEVNFCPGCGKEL